MKRLLSGMLPAILLFAVAMLMIEASIGLIVGRPWPVVRGLTGCVFYLFLQCSRVTTFHKATKKRARQY